MKYRNVVKRNMKNKGVWSTNNVKDKEEGV